MEIDEKRNKLVELMKQVLETLSPSNLSEETLKNTPKRVADSLIEFTQGYENNFSEIINGGIFDSEGYDQLIIVKDISFSSLCEHHLLPYFGKCNVGYIPKNYIIGLSKFPRIITYLSKKLSIQERLTKEIADKINDYISPEGVIVTIEAVHSCICFRGSMSFDSKTKTIYCLGTLKEKDNLNKYFELMK